MGLDNGIEVKRTYYTNDIPELQRFNQPWNKEHKYNLWRNYQTIFLIKTSMHIAQTVMLWKIMRMLFVNLTMLLQILLSDNCKIKFYTLNFYLFINRIL